MAKKSRLTLIIDDEESIRDGCQQILTRMGHEVQSTGDPQVGIELALQNRFDIILLDVRLPKIEGLEVLRILKKDHNISSKIIIITGYGTIPLAVEAMRLGDINLLTKPFGASELREAIHDCLDAPIGNQSEDKFSMLIGSSDYMKELRNTIRRIAQTDSTVLITGESGTGKELVARTMHLSASVSTALHPVDCSSWCRTSWRASSSGMPRFVQRCTESREGRFQIADRGRCSLMSSQYQPRYPGQAPEGHLGTGNPQGRQLDP